MMFRLLTAAMIVALTAGASAEESTVTGELVDVACYTKDKVKNRGVVHHDCATLCAMKGDTLAVVTDEGVVYEIAGELTKDRNAFLAPQMTRRVVVTGNVVEQNGKRIISATSVKIAGPRFKT